MTKSEQEDERGIIAFRAPHKLMADASAAADHEGITRAAFARRALIVDLARRRATIPLVELGQRYLQEDNRAD